MRELTNIPLIYKEGKNIVLETPNTDNLQTLFLGTAKSIGVSTIDGNTKSGNAAHDAHSGKFGSTGAKPKGPAVPANTSNVSQYLALRDLVVDAARDIGVTDPNSLLSFVKGRTARPPSEGELNQILAQIQKARINDLVDWIDAQMSGKGRQRSSGRATLNAPKVWIRQAFEQASDQDISDIVTRLEAKGWDRKKALTTTVNKVPDKSRRQTLEETLN